MLGLKDGPEWSRLVAKVIGMPTEEETKKAATKGPHVQVQSQSDESETGGKRRQELDRVIGMQEQAAATLPLVYRRCTFKWFEISASALLKGQAAEGAAALGPMVRSSATYHRHFEQSYEGKRQARIAAQILLRMWHTRLSGSA